MNFDNIIQTILVYAIPVLFAITIHEAAHGYVARYFGDNTAYVLGRVTLNPLKHIDPVGTIVMPLTLAILSQGMFAFGYAKPVPVQFGRLRNPKRDMIWVALAGPVSNIVQAVIWAVFWSFLTGFQVSERYFFEVAMAGIQINLVLCALNLFPLPPLDGGRVMVGLLPWKQAQFLSRAEPFGMIIVIVLLVTHLLDRYWLIPLIDLGSSLLNLITVPLVGLMR